MSQEQGWRPLRPPTRPQATVTSSFTRLARTHAFSVAADASLATALAGSLFFSIPTGQARGKILLYLVITMAPYSVVAPIIGPALDRIRGGRRLMIIGSCALRAVFAFFMISSITDSLALFPEAFMVLILQKSYNVSRASLVPSTVRSEDELVEANSKLSIISAIGSILGAAPGALALKLGGPGWSLVIAVVLYLVAVAFGTRLHKERREEQPAAEVVQAERHELHNPTILLAASAMALIRGTVGFLTFFVAFSFKSGGIPWRLGLVGAASIAGTLLGAALAPIARRHTREENILIGGLVLGVAAAAAALLLGGIEGASVMAFMLGVAASSAKLAFDTIVQRDAPDADWSRSFARFETRFQLLWVIGALIAIAPMPLEVGFAVMLCTLLFATFTYVVGLYAAKARSGDRSKVSATAEEIDDRMHALTGEAKKRVGHAMRNGARRIRRPQRGSSGPVEPSSGEAPAPPRSAPPDPAEPYPAERPHPRGAEPPSWGQPRQASTSPEPVWDEPPITEPPFWEEPPVTVQQPPDPDERRRPPSPGPRQPF